MGNEQRSEAKIDHSTTRDGLSRFAREYLNIPIALSVPECIQHGVPMENGRISFSQGALWYRFRRLRFSYSLAGAPSNMSASGIVCEDPEFMTEVWLVSVYQDILEGLSSVDPFHTEEGTAGFRHDATPIKLFKGEGNSRVKCWIEAYGEGMFVVGGLDYSIDSLSHRNAEMGGSLMIRVTHLSFTKPE